MNSNIVARLVAVGMTVLVGCASGDEAGSSDDHLEAAKATPRLVSNLTDAQLATSLEAAPKDLTEAQALVLVADTMRPLATTPRLKLLNDFIAKHGESEGRDILASAMEGILWATPRDLVSNPAGYGGQSLATTTSVDSGIAGPSKLTIKGDAKTAYTLDFMIAGVHVSGIKVPAGANPAATAKLIKAALEPLNEKIMESIGDDKTFAPIGGDHADSPSGVDDVEVSTTKNAVVILVAQNG